MNIIDGSVGGVARALTSLAVRTPSVALADVRAAAAERALRSVHHRAGSLHASLLAGDPGARAALATLADEALATLAKETQGEARRRGRLAELATRLDARFAATDASEWLDDPGFDRDARVRVLEHLDRLNTIAGSYRAFWGSLRPFLRTDGRPTRILDLAAGHGGFALAAARLARAEGRTIELVASDLKKEYLDIGAAIARRESLDVAFEVQDALDLGNRDHGEFDIVVCTQSLHHFPPGLVAVLAAEASRIAGRGVVLIDGYRSRTHAVLVPALGLLRFADVAFAHDAWVSFRRFWTPEELGLLARLGPHGARVDARWAPPTHCIVSIDLR